METAIALGSLALGGTAAYQTYAQAQARNEALAAAGRSQVSAARTAMAQTTEAAQLEKDKVSNEAHLIRSRLRAAAGETIGTGGTFDALVRQAEYDEVMNRRIIGKNLEWQLQRISSGAGANLDALAARRRPNPLISGMFQGITTGLTVFGSGLRIHDTLTGDD